VDIESVVREYLRPATALNPTGDLPPKYEEVGDELPPPQYDEDTMKPTAETVNTEEQNVSKEDKTNGGKQEK